MLLVDPAVLPCGLYISQSPRGEGRGEERIDDGTIVVIGFRLSGMQRGIDILI